MRTPAPNATGAPDGTWTFITNHGAALLLIAQDPDIRLCNLADRIEVTERAAQRVVRDLVRGGYVQVVRQGRRNHYRINPHAHMRHPIVRTIELCKLLDLAGGGVQTLAGAPGEMADTSR